MKSFIVLHWIYVMVCERRCIPKDWKSSVVLPIYKGKGDPVDCGSYRGIRLLEHAVKVVERIFEHTIWEQIEIVDMQFGFMKGKGTTDAIFTVSQRQENFRVQSKKLSFGFVDLENAFETVPREVISWAVRKLGVEEWLVSAVMSVYTGAKQSSELFVVIVKVLRIKWVCTKGQD